MITPTKQMEKDVTNAEESITQASACIDKLSKESLKKVREIEMCSPCVLSMLYYSFYHMHV